MQSRYQQSAKNYFLVKLPVHFSSDIDVIHEALDVEWQIRGVSAHQFLKFFTLLVEPDQSPGL